MKVLVACEFSGTVREAFAARGHDAWSCDILPTSKPSNKHIRGDVLSILEDNWDLVIAHPPCTHLATSGAKHFHRKQQEQQEAVDFFMQFARLDHVPRVAIENPVSIMSTRWRKPDQIIHPWQFGHAHTPKRTCLWLKGLPLLQPTDIRESWSVMQKIHMMGESKARAAKRSTTFEGIAKAMATQWG